MWRQANRPENLFKFKQTRIVGFLTFDTGALNRAIFVPVLHGPH